MPEEKDLMDQVGQTFNLPDENTQQQDTGDDGSGGQLDQGAIDQQQQQADDGSQQPGRQETGSDRHQPEGKDQLFADKPKKGPKGELLGKNGEVIATTRREKQLAYNLNRAQYAANQAARDVKRYQEALQTYKRFDDTIKQNGLNGQMVQEALQLRALAEKDPILAVRDIVARVLSTGVTMEELFGTDAVPQINARVITNELDRRLGPLEKQTQQAERQKQIEVQAQAQMERFVQQHPHAETHGVEISNLVTQHGLTPERAYFELRSWVERRGFDFTSPLRPQIEGAMKRQRTNGGAQRGRRATTPGDMRGIQPNSSMTTQRGNARGDFKSNAPWKDIASAVYTELNNR
jgi:hypothetical protein